ncbi:nucleoside phosphorylase/CheY-like chemotaxis protein [Nitrobacteraceae bacterium AZCC 2146]
MNVEFRVLIVEDSAEKYQRIVALLEVRLSHISCKFVWADEYNSAVRTLTESTFDLVVLDLLIPVAAGTVSAENSRTLLSMMQAGELTPVPHIIGLTQHSAVAETERAYYSESLLALELFSFETEDWADRIAGKIIYLIKSKTASVQFISNNYQTDLLIVVARYENEFKPISEKMDWESDPSKNSPYFPTHRTLTGRMTFEGGRSLRTTLICIGEMGIASAAVLTSQAISLLRPRIVSMLGMACGFNHERSSSPALFGDVLIARECACWEEGKYLEYGKEKERLFRNRANIRTVDGAIAPVLSATIETASESIVPIFATFLKSAGSRKLREAYGESIRQTPELKYGMVVSGSSVIADSAQIDEIIKRHPSAVGLEMELYGVFTAAQKCVGRPPGVLGIKGVADFGDGAKHKHIQAYASILSFYTLIGILRELYAGGRVLPVS